MRWLGALLMAALTALVGVRLTGLDAGTVLALPVAAFPLAAAGTAVLLGVLAGSRRRRLAGCAAVLVTVQLILMVPRFVPTAPDAPAGASRLRVATSNSQQGHVDPVALVELVRAQRIDVLAVQELTPAGLPALDRAGLRALLPYMVQQPGGDAVLYARRPLSADASPPAPTTWPPTTASITIAGRPIRLVTVHTYYPAGNPRRWNQDLIALRDHARTLTTRPAGRDLVLLGDLNATVDHAPLRALLAAGLADVHLELGRGWAPTWPTSRRLPPLLQLDHVLHGPGLVAVSTSEHTLPGTDHRAVVAELALVD